MEVEKVEDSIPIPPSPEKKEEEVKLVQTVILPPSKKPFIMTEARKANLAKANEIRAKNVMERKQKKQKEGKEESTDSLFLKDPYFKKIESQIEEYRSNLQKQIEEIKHKSVKMSTPESTPTPEIPTESVVKKRVLDQTFESSDSDTDIEESKSKSRRKSKELKKIQEITRNLKEELKKQKNKKGKGRKKREYVSSSEDDSDDESDEEEYRSSKKERKGYMHEKYKHTQQDPIVLTRSSVRGGRMFS